MPFGGELTSIRVQSVGEDHAGLQLVEKLAKPLLAPKIQPGGERGFHGVRVSRFCRLYLCRSGLDCIHTDNQDKRCGAKTKGRTDRKAL